MGAISAASSGPLSAAQYLDARLQPRPLRIGWGHTVSDLLTELRSACSRSDAKQVRASAHGIKGAASNICAEPIRDLARRIEEMGKRDELEHLDSALVQMQDPMDRLRTFVDAHTNEGRPRSASR